MANETEVKTYIETAAKAVETAQKLTDDLPEIIGKHDSVVKAINAGAEAIETAQALKQEIFANNEAVKAMETRLARMVAGGGVEQQVENSKQAQETVSYLRKGKVISPDTIQTICHDMAKVCVFGDDEDIKSYAGIFYKDLSVGSAQDGGFWLMPQRANRIIKRVFETSPIRMLADIQTTSNDSLEYVVDDDQVSSGWVGEVDARPVTNTPKIGKQVIPVMELYANPETTQKILDDAGFDIESWLTTKLSDKFGRDENTAFVSGNSPKRPRGFLTYADASDVDAYEYGKIGTLTSASSGVITGDDLITTQSHLKEYYQANAKWLMLRQSFASVATLKDSGGRYIFQTYFLDGRLNMMLLGKDIVFAADMPAVAASAYSFVYADFKEAYTIVDRYGIRVLRDPYTNKGFVQFYSTKRVGGDMGNFDAMKRIKIHA